MKPLVFAAFFALLPAAPVVAQSEKKTAPEPAAAETQKAEAPAETRVDAAAEEAPAPRELDLSSPRATMREFLLANQDAFRDRPERIEDAVKCLDMSELDGEDVAERARVLARRLFTVIDNEGVRLDDIPEEPTEDSWVFRTVEPAEGEEGEVVAITLGLDPQTGSWLFTSSTLAAIPILEKRVEKDVKEEKAATTDAAGEIPATRRTPRATMATFLEAMNSKPPNNAEAVKCLDPTGQDEKVWGVLGPELAVKLKNVMDKTKEVVLPEIPDKPDGEPYVLYTGKTGNIVIARIAEGDLKKEWRFTPQTLKTIDALYKEFEKKEVIGALKEQGVEERLTLGLRLQRLMPDWARGEYFSLQGWQWVALAALLPIGWLIRLIGAAITAVLLGTWLRRRKIDLGKDARRRTYRSFGALAMTIFWWHIINANYLQLPPGLLASLLPLIKLAMGVTAVWVGYRFVDILGGRIAADKSVRLTRFDDVLIPMLQKILRLFIVLVAILLVLDWIGYSPKTILGALGIGGLAVAFAAQDTIGNFFGSITVLLDRPFGIGDWINIGDVHGTVERVGFRSTRLRTFYNSVVTIPNSKIVNTQVDNYGARRYRRANIMLSITYDTPPEKIDAFCEGIRELIRLHPHTRKDYYHVYFNQFAASSLDIMLYTFFEVPDWGTELRERHRLFVDIVRLAKRLGVEFAYPTQTLWMERSRRGEQPARPASRTPSSGDPEAFGAEEAARLYDEVYGDDGHRGPVIIDTIPRSKRSQH